MSLAQALDALIAHDTEHPGDLSDARWALVRAVLAANDARVWRLAEGRPSPEDLEPGELSAVTEAPDVAAGSTGSRVLRSQADLLAAIAAWLEGGPQDTTWWGWACDHVFWVDLYTEDVIRAAMAQCAHLLQAPALPAREPSGDEVMAVANAAAELCNHCIEAGWIGPGCPADALAAAIPPLLVPLALSADPSLACAAAHLRDAVTVALEQDWGAGERRARLVADSCWLAGAYLRQWRRAP